MGVCFVVDYISCSDVVVLGNGTCDVTLSVAEFYVRLFRRYHLFRNECEAVWSSVDQLITTQLVAAEQNKLVPCVHSSLAVYHLTFFIMHCLRCFDTAGSASGRTSGL